MSSNVLLFNAKSGMAFGDSWFNCAPFLPICGSEMTFGARTVPGRERASTSVDPPTAQDFFQRINMVLQDKYKAKASRRYQAKHGMGTGGGEESSGRGRGGGRGRGRGRGRGGGGSFMERNGFADPNKDSEEDDDEESEGDDGEDEGEDHIQSTDAQASGAGPSSPPKTSRGGKYSKRKLTSNAWRFEHPSDEEEDNPSEQASTISTNPHCPS